MVTPIGNHGLTCLTDNDYAAVALHMQDQARTLDAALAGISNELTAYNNRMSFVVTSTVTSSFPALGGQIMPDGREANNVSFAGGTFLGGGASLIAGGNILFIPPESGWYDIGGYVNVVAAGAITANSERVLYLLTVQTQANVLQPTQNVYKYRTTETNTGGEFLETSALIYAEAGRSLSLQLLVSHQNLASNLNLNAGAKIWATFMGPKGVIVVA